MKVWTLEIRGGQPFDLQLSPESGAQNPTLHHDGERSLWKMVGTVEVLEAVRAALLEQGAQIKVFTEYREDSAMPIYTFACAKCGHVFNAMQKYDDPCPACPKPVSAEDPTPCGGETERKMSKTNFELKGNGWAKDGYG